MVGSDDPIPSLNRWVQNAVCRGETFTYADCLATLANITKVTEKEANKEGLDKQLTRLLQFGYLRVSSAEALLKALRGSTDKDTVPLFTRVLFYLTQLALGNGAAGTPLPPFANRSNPHLPKALDIYGPEVLSAAWADLSEEKSTFMRKQGAMRILAALAAASLTSKPDDPTYPAGVLLTLQSLLDSIDELDRGRNSLLSQLATATKRKNVLADFKQQMETSGLLRLAFSAARVALTKSGIAQVADRSFRGVCSPDSACARHSLALACVVAREGGAGGYASTIGRSLQYNVELGKKTGQLYQAGGKGKAGAAPPTVVRDDTSNYLNLKDTFSRIYLARGCAAVIQAGHGDASSPFWDALVLLGCADLSDVVAHEAIRAMFGAPCPHPESLRRRAGPLGEAELQEITMQGRVYGLSWSNIMSTADALPQIPPEHMPPVHDALVSQTPLKAADSSSGGGLQPTNSGDVEVVGAAVSLFGRLTARVLYALQSRSVSMIAAGAKTAAVMLEARAWFASMGHQQLETESVKKCIRVLQALLVAVFSSEGLGAVERAAAAEALVWLQLTPPEDYRYSTLTPMSLLKAAGQGGMAVQSVVKGLFADPWPEGLVVSMMNCLHRRQRCNPALSPWVCELASALAAATPSHMPRDLLLSLWDAAPGDVSVKCAVELLGSPLPPITQPTSGCPVEIKALAATEEQAYEALRATAAWWLGEHANTLSGVSVFKAAPKASVALDFLSPGDGADGGVSKLEVGERLMLAATAQAPLLVMATAHLQRHMIAGSWEVRLACAQAVAKIAVRSPEPYRIQGYAALRAASQGPAISPCGLHGCPAPLSSWMDPLGLAPVVLPALEILDAMYAGQQVMAIQFNLNGAEAKEWPDAALKSVRRRHEWLLGAVAQRVGNMAKDGFFPLGRRTRTLLNPGASGSYVLVALSKFEHWLLHVDHSVTADEKAEDEQVEADEDEKALDAAKKAAAKDKGQEEGEQQQPDAYYDDQYYDDEYYQQYYDEHGGTVQGTYRDAADPLAKWNADGANGQDYSQVATVNWKGIGRTASSYYDNGAQDEEDLRYGKVLFAFSAEGEEEVSVQQGERVRVHVDMGDWLHVTNAAGQEGMVPASYIQIEQPQYERSESAASRRSSVLPPRPSGQYGYDQGGEGYELGYGGETYRNYGDYDGQGQEVGLYDGDDKQVGAGGFDDFSSILAQAAKLRAEAAQRAAEKASSKQAAAPPQLQSNPSMVSNSSFDSSVAPTPSGPIQPQASTSTTGFNLQPAYSMQSSVGASTRDTETPRPPETSYAQESGYGQYGQYNQWGTNAYEDSSTQQTSGTTSPAPAGWGGAGYGGFEEPLVQSQLPIQVSAAETEAAQPQAGGRIRMAYDFTAETAEELTVVAGDDLEIVNVLDGWLMVRASDGRSGLVPENYVEYM